MQLARAYQQGPNHAPGGRRAAYEDDDPAPTSYFDTAFTATANPLLESIYTDPNVNPDTRLLLFISRFSTGWLKPEAILSEAFILEGTGMSRSSLYRSKINLVNAGSIIISHTKAGNCVYRLAPHLQCLKGASLGPQTAAKKAEKRWNGSPVGHPHRVYPDTSCKENKENLDQQHRPSAPPVPEPFGDDELLEVVIELEREWNGPDETPDPEEPTCAPGDTARPAHQEQPQPPARSAELGRLIAQLIEQGVHERVAVRLAKTQTPEVIASAIKRLPKVATTNPAGYLVAEISRGGYKEPDRTKPIRVIQDEIHRQRQAERERDAEAREQSSAKVAQTVDRFALLPPDHQAEIRDRLRRQAEAEGFTRLPGWSQDHPVYRGLLAEMVAEWIPSALPGVVLAPG